MRRRAGAQRDRGQSTVELALALPVVAVLLLLVLQAGLMGRDLIGVHHAAREAARAAAVDAAPGAARTAASASGGLDAERLRVAVRRHRTRSGWAVTVTLTYRVEPAVPLVGAWVAGRSIHATATMHDETR